MLYYMQIILVLLFISSIFGYIFVILKEKIYLKNNIIIIDKKIVTQEHLNEVDMKEFILDGFRLKAGDEIKVITKENKKYNGILLGAKKKDKSIMIVTHKNEVKFFTIDNILKFKIVSKYGKFFT
ncbi:hypothetical protein [Tissierella praeacuta]|uniref:hypothetical protein n=2 Tax=Tissierella praeacuta TaxID=43131 RepID=UPI000A013D3C|nr:hypothetical protein [Tissierella praeacuta]MBU5254953.1 hypothetical protein [Tissierella praeacuta]SUP01165.1 Uncharacterised protein [Tissierella praeacuta]HAE91227.1 hypothetical protein [Tissierella sp.]